MHTRVIYTIMECYYPAAYRLEEKFIKQILWQTLQGVKYCHENQVGCVHSVNVP